MIKSIVCVTVPFYRRIRMKIPWKSSYQYLESTFNEILLICFFILVPSVDGPIFNITRVNRLHMGAYLCIASNGVPPSVSKRIMLIVHCEYIYTCQQQPSVILVDISLVVLCLLYSSSYDLDTEPACGGVRGSADDFGVSLRSLPQVYQLLDEGERRYHSAR